MQLDLGSKAVKIYCTGFDQYRITATVRASGVHNEAECGPRSPSC